MKRSKILILSIGGGVVLLAAVIGLAVLFSSTGTKSSSQSVATYTITAQPETLLSGNVIPSETDSYSLDASLGTLSSVDVKDGQTVKAGDTLLTYESTNANLTELTFAVQNAQNTLDNANADVTDAQNQLSQLKTQLATATDPTEQASINTQIVAAYQTLGQQERSVTTAQLALTQAQTQLSQAKSGETVTVQAKQAGIAQVNANAASGQPLVSIVSNTRLITATVSEFDYDKLKDGVTVTISTLNGDTHTTGQITDISQIPNSTASTAGASTGGGSSVVTYNFTVAPNATIQYGFTVQIGLKNTDVIIPQSAVAAGKVEVKTASGFENRTVKVEAMNGQYKVLNGLKIGDVIAQNGTDGTSGS